jgi:hypothetical protein
MENEFRRARILNLAPLAGRARAAFGGRSFKKNAEAGFGYREAPGEGDSPRTPQPQNSRRQPLTPTLSPQVRGEGAH